MSRPHAPSRYHPDTLPPPAHWQEHAACRGVHWLFYPEGDKGTVHLEIQEAKRYCRSCPVLMQCRLEALERREPYGVWGGLTEKERRALLRRVPAALIARAAAAAREEGAGACPS